MDYVGFNANMKPDRLAIRDLTHDRRWSYAELDQFVARCATLLSKQGVMKGERVGVLSKSRAEVVALHLACARLGAMIVPFNWRLSAPEIQVQIDDSAPIVMYGDEVAQEKGINAQDINSLVQTCEAVQPVDFPDIDIDLPSLILFTSGTTGRPKGAMISERNIFETAFNFSLFGQVDSDSVFLAESPMFHIIGLLTSIRPAFLVGGHVLVSDGFIPERTLARLSDPDLKISHYFCVPQMAVALRNAENFDPRKLAKLTALFTGGAPHPAQQIRDWLNDGILVNDGYGSTEGGSVMHMPLDKGLIDKKAGCVGFPTPRMNYRLVDAVGELVPANVPGELQLKGDNVFLGYWRQEEEYKKVLTLDGWFRTGDVLVCDDDGYFRVVDRIKDMFISGGENIYPVEIEALLVKYPGLSELAVVGVPDEEWGEVGCVFYASTEVSLLPPQIEEFLDGKLARYKLPRKTFKVDALPRNGAGKVLKAELRRMFQSATR